MRFKNTYATILLASVLLIASCKKEEDNNTNNNTNNPMSAYGASPDIPAGAAGALYCIKNTTEDDIFGTDIEGSAFAWFNSYSSTDDAGAVTVNGDSLKTTIPGTSFKIPWYYGDGEDNLAGTIDFSSSSTAQWKISGTSKVPAFNYTDNTAFPVASFIAPASVSISSPFTLSYTIAGTHDLVMCSISGESEESVTKSLAKGSGTVTFTAAEVAKCSFGQDDKIQIQVMPCTITSGKISSKTYYFVKQGATNKYAETKP
jgi:hypothetical protein